MDYGMRSAQVNSNTLVFDKDFDSLPTIKLLGLTDVHYDSPYCDRKLLRKHLRQAQKEGAYVFFNGDLFDVMGSYRDPRSKPQDVRPEYFQNDKSYLDAVIEDVYKFLLPYKDIILFMGYGNHETSMLKHHDTDPLDRLVFMLNQAGSNILKSQYYGYIFFNIHPKGHNRQFILVHHHGFGGNAHRSKGVLSVDLNSQSWPFADIIFTGHTHKKWHVPTVSYKAKKNYEVVPHTQHHVSGGSYKNTYNKNQGWEVEKGFKPVPIGGFWIELKLRGREYKNKIIEIKEAT